MVALLTCAVLAIAAWRISRAPCFQIVGEITCRVDTAEKIVALSFDDGPTPEGVTAVLSALEPRGIKATFFLIGRQMEKHPDQARRLLAAGHELGNHSTTHVWMIGRTASFYDEEIGRTDALLRAEGLARPRLFRPPFGKKLIGLPLAVERAGYQTVTWDVADKSSNHDPKAYARDILSRVRPGSIILIHPMYRTGQTARDALPAIIDGLVAKGYRVVPVGTLLREHARSAV